jgi:serine/threonine protein kinase
MIALEPGAIIAGRFRVEQVLGTGGWSAVFGCREIGSERKCAVKCIKAPETETGETLESQCEEARVLASIRHRNVVRVDDVGIWEEGVFLVLEWLEGIGLDYRLAQGVLSVDETIVLATECLEGLAAAHRKGFLHLDIKPGNIMLQASPKGLFQVKLIDFGLAQLRGGNVRAKEEGSHVTGTLQYVPPERLMHLEADGRADLYSLGHVLYEALTGDAAYGDSFSPDQIMAAHMTQDPPEILAIRPDCGESFAFWLRRMMARAPEHRPESAAEGLRELMQIQSEIIRLQEQLPPSAEKEEIAAGWISRLWGNLRVSKPSK